MRPNVRTAAWWYWLATGAGLVATMADRPGAAAATVLLGVVQGVHFAWRARDPTALPVQVRLAFVVVILAGICLPAAWLLWLPLVGILIRVGFGYCLAGRMLKLMPWNRAEPLSRDLVWRAFSVRRAEDA